MINWIKIEDEFPPDGLMDRQDILILLNNGNIGIGHFFYKDGEIERMSFNGTGKHMDFWGYLKPTHWAIVDLPEGI